MKTKLKDDLRVRVCPTCKEIRKGAIDFILHLKRRHGYELPIAVFCAKPIKKGA
jgi:uncharacterized C2H2 Zn-finger protein